MATFRINPSYTALCCYRLTSGQGIVDVTGNTVATPVGSPTQQSDGVVFDQSTVAQYIELDADVGAAAAATIVLKVTKSGTTSGSGRTRVLAAIANRSAADEATKYAVTLGNDFGGAGTKEKIRFEASGAAATGLWVGGTKQASNEISDSEYSSGTTLGIVVRTSSLADGLANTRIGGGNGSNNYGMTGTVHIAAIISGQLTDAQCQALSVNPYLLLATGGSRKMLNCVGRGMR